MLTRRAATTLLAGVAAAPWNARADNAHSGALFYDAVAPLLQAGRSTSATLRSRARPVWQHLH